ncbi:unnamed protein product [Allacma fusca]|uniref:Transmembrane protein 45B n=1 Tax=Allacma fusca TaxID=39272 RepID=A0A8J2JEB2_9HEXA|nr:unnamed protein product [Allacma fusca]
MGSINANTQRGEFITGFKDGHWTHMANAQHITMFFFFGLNGVVDLLQYKKWDLPPKLDYVSAALAFAIEGFLFYFHLHGRSHMDVQVHMFLFQTVVACVVSTLLEMQHSHNVILALCRTFFTLLQGTWFFQIGFILYPPIGENWDEEDHDQMMVITLIFTWHVAALLATMTGLGIIIYLRVKSLKDSLSSYQLVETKESLLDDEGQVTLNGRINSSSPRVHQIIDSDSEDV